MSSVTNRVIEDLTEKSFPTLVLLNGDWGSGKTFLAKNELIPALEKELRLPVHYLSLYGVESLENFRDKVISKTTPLFGHERVSRLKKLTTSISKFFDKGATEGVLSVLTGALKSKLLDETKNTVFVLDDLERVGDMDLINQILGESLNLVENNHNVCVVVIANKSQIDEHSGIEKVFQLQIEHTLSAQDIVHIIESDYSRHWNTEHSPIIINELESLKVTNLRVIKRAMQRFCPLKEQIMKIDGIHHDKAIPELFIRILRICLAYYTEKFSLEQIQDIEAYDQYSYKNVFMLDEQETKVESETEKELKRLGTLIVEKNTLLINHCLLNRKIDTEDLHNLHLPSKNPIENIVSFSRNNFHHLSDDELQQNFAACRTYLLNDTPVEMDQWVDIASLLTHLIEKHYIEADLAVLQNELKKMATQPQKFISSSSPYYVGSLGSNSSNSQFIKELKEQLEANREPLYIKQRIEEIKPKFLSSFSAVDQDLQSEFSFKPYLHLFSVEELISILDNWPTIELLRFSSYIGARYYAGNIADYLAEERHILDGFRQALEASFKDKPASMKVGITRRLHESIELALTRLTASIENSEKIQEGCR